MAEISEGTFEPGEFSFKVRQLVEAGQAIPINQVWTYASMTELVGHEMVGNDPALQVALQRLSRDHGLEFKNVRKIGYLRLDDAGIVEMAVPDRQSIKNRVRRSIQRSSNIQEWEKLSNNHKCEADAHRSLFALMRHLLKPSSLNQIRHEVTEVHKELDVEKTLALFRPKDS